MSKGTNMITQQNFVKAFLLTLEETVEHAGGYLDEGTSLFETLADISAEQASIPVSSTCACLAAQVEHVRFYLDVVLDFAEGNAPGPVDWDDIWETVSAVTPAEWQASQDRLRLSYQRVQAFARSDGAWEHPDSIHGALGLLAHTAYHLGEIRQALCTLQR
jgi:hypothetical protein